MTNIRNNENRSYMLQAGRIRVPIDKEDLDSLNNEDDKRIRGLGDVIKKVTDFMHIPQCGGCKSRQEKLNQMVPFRKSGKQ